jgi:hypothetical protein
MDAPEVIPGTRARPRGAQKEVTKNQVLGILATNQRQVHPYFDRRMSEVDQTGGDDDHGLASHGHVQERTEAGGSGKEGLGRTGKPRTHTLTRAPHFKLKRRWHWV